MSRLVFVVLVSITATLAAQQTAPAFEVVAIKRNVSGGPGSYLGTQPGGRFTITNLAVRQVILRAFGIRSFQLVGGPDWVPNDRYDIQAKAPEGAATTSDATNVMLRAMLADRFKLKVRRETRDSPIFELVLARSDRRLGEKLRQTSAECVADLARGTLPAGDAALIGPRDLIPCGGHVRWQPHRGGWADGGAACDYAR